MLHAAYFACTLLTPLVFACFCYLTLRPLQRRICRSGLPSTLAAIGILSVVLMIVGIFGLLVSDPIKSIIAELPTAVSEIKLKTSDLMGRFSSVSNATDQLDEIGDTEVADKPLEVEIQQPAWSTNLTLLSGTGSLVSFISIAGVVLYFLLAFGDDALRAVLRSIPKLSDKKRVVSTIEDVQDAVSGYLIRVTIINFFLGVAVAIAMYLMSMPTPLVWGIMAATFNYVPIVGAVVGAIILFLAALLNFDETTTPFLVTGLFLALTTIEGQFITPAILGKTLDVNPLLIVLALIIFGWIWGFMGALLSVPMLIAGHMIFRNLFPEDLEAIQT